MLALLAIGESRALLRLTLVLIALVGVTACGVAAGEELTAPMAVIVRDPLPPHADVRPVEVVSWHPPGFDPAPLIRWWAVVAFREAGERLAAIARIRARPAFVAPTPRVSAPAPPGDLQGVMACIRGAESGNYAESSHPGAGSGAYQFIPGTWRAWAERAGFPGYDYAYQAPASVQDAVVVFTLTHGGAGNWSNRWGNDGCTAGLPGGG